MSKHEDAVTYVTQDAAYRAFFEAMCAEAARSQARHDPYHSLHECYAVLLEEVEEVWEEVRKRNSQRDAANLLRELMQVASVAMRAAYECGLFAGYSGWDDPTLWRAFRGEHGEHGEHERDSEEDADAVA